MHWDEFKDWIDEMDRNLRVKSIDVANYDYKKESINTLLREIVHERKTKNIVEDIATFRRMLDQYIDGGIFEIPTDKGFLRAPLIRAVKQGRVDMMRILLDKGADVDACDMAGNTSLHFAANRGEFEAVSLLSKYGVNMSPMNHRGSTPLHWIHNMDADNILSDKTVAMASLLVKAGADVNAGTQTTPFIETTQRIDTQKIPWDYYKSSPPHIELLDLMMQHNADIDAIDNYGNTALHYATLQGLPWMITWLLSHGASMHITNLNGHTPLEMILDTRETPREFEKGHDLPWTGNGPDDRHLVELRMQKKRLHPTMQNLLVDVLLQETRHERNHAFYGGTHERSRNSLIHMLQPEIFRRIVVPYQPTDRDKYVNQIVNRRWQLRHSRGLRQ